MTCESIMLAEIADSYKTPAERAAYRAGLSTAAGICDEKAEAVRKASPGRKRGTASSVGEFGADIAKQCGDAIMAARDKIIVRQTTKE